jgi:hypothetical protein
MDIMMQGVVHGSTIELESSPGLEDGRKVQLILRVGMLPGPPPKWTPGNTATAGGTMAAHWTDEDDKLLEEIYQDRKSDRRRARR